MQSYSLVTLIWFVLSFAEIFLLLKAITEVAYEQDREVFTIRPPSNAVTSSDLEATRGRVRAKSKHKSKSKKRE
jgi:hypothetical protein